MPALIALALAAAPAPKSILFIGNSFTFGADSPVMEYRPGSVTDLNRGGIGGVPALFASFAAQAGQRWRVSLETAPGRSLEWHWANRRTLLDRRWDAVVMQDYSTLDEARPGDASKLVAYSGRLASLFRRRSPTVRLSLTATWTRPDLTFPAGKPWSGKPVTRMAQDLRRGYDRANAASRAITRVHPVGEAFSCAIQRGIADGNPYDGLSAGQVNLWSADHYHASTAGYYLHALVVFAGVTGIDPVRLGKDERAGRELGMESAVTVQLQQVARDMALRKGCI
jgi:hypothetical protein